MADEKSLRSRNPRRSGARCFRPISSACCVNTAPSPPATSPLNFEKRTGMFNCAACGQPLFESSTKYESGSGWPSFFRPLPARSRPRPTARTA